MTLLSDWSLASADPGGARGVLAAIERLRAQGVAAALALVIDTHGSTYRKPGAIAMVAADGTRVGTLSGGCLEPEIERVGSATARDRQARIVELDTRTDDDLVFGSGSGCRGSMRVLVLPVAAAGAADLASTLARAADSGRTLRLALALDPASLGAWSARFADDPSATATAGAGARDALLASALLLDQGIHELVHAGSTSAVARLDFAAAPQVVLFGAGPEAPVLTAWCRQLGWFVTVIDHREGLCNSARLPAADRLILARPTAGLHALAGATIDAAIVMTHLATADREALDALSTRAAPSYIGLLGPRARREELLALLSTDNKQALETRVHGPAGLNLGGEGPEAIALSLVAGLQQHFATRDER